MTRRACTATGCRATELRRQIAGLGAADQHERERMPASIRGAPT